MIDIRLIGIINNREKGFSICKQCGDQWEWMVQPEFLSSKLLFLKCCGKCDSSENIRAVAGWREADERP